MTRLKALELVGFKSFADRTRFEFPDGVTAIVGPNGSGKSNVVDAIKWVLGEQSVKSLRGKEMADVIFAGSAGRRPLNSAETTLVFDNSTRLLPIESDELQITRRVYRSGESEYLVNGAVARLRDIREILSGTGAATEAYSVIEQGRVDALLVASGRDRRAVFEEAAGITRFRTRRAEAIRRLERTEQSRQRLIDIVGEITARLATVRQQAARARRHQERTARLKSLRLAAAAIDLAVVDADASRHADAISRLHEEKAIHEGVMADASARLAHVAAEDAALESRLGEVLANLAGAERRAAGVEAAMALLAHRHGELESQAADAEVERGRARARCRDADRAAVAAEASLAAAERELTMVAERLAACQDHVGASVDVLVDARETVAIRRREVKDAEAALATSATVVARLEDALVRAGESTLSSVGAVEAANRRLARTNDSIVACEASLASAHCGSMAAKDDLALLESMDRLCRSRELGLQNDIAEALAKLEACRERATVLEELDANFEGISRPAIELLASGIPGLRGFVAEAITADPGIAALVDAAIGRIAGSLLVEASGEAMDWLDGDAGRRSALGGRITFLLADRIPPVDSDPLAGFDGVVGRLDRLLSGVTSQHPAIERLLGRVWVVEDLATARRLVASAPAGSVLVTRAGDAISTDGTLEFGPIGTAGGLVSRKSELAMLSARGTGLSARVDELRGSLAALESDREDLQTAIDTARHRVEEESATLASTRTELERLRHEQSSAAAAIAEAEATQLAEAARERDARGRLDRACAEQADRHAAVLAATEALALAESTLDALDRTRGETLETISQLRIEEAECRQRRLAADDVVVARRHDRDTSRQLLAAVHDRRAAIQGQQRTLDLERLTAGADFAEACWTVESLARARGAVVDARRATSEERAVLLATTDQARDAIASLSASLHAEEMEAGEVRHRRERILERIRDEYGIDIETDAPAEPAADIPADRESLDGEIEELRRKLAASPSVNLEALAEAEELERRHSSMEAQLADLTAAKEAIEGLIERIDDESRQLLGSTIETVRGHFRELFESLFGGGQADIVLDPSMDLLETTVEIVARPPGKEPRSISLLSGGEKTMTCVALLLAIFKSRPSPFCVLDEVDAALDESNVDRFVGVLRDFLSSTQFIVVTHSKKTMAAADNLYGVTMEESGVSKRVAVRLERSQAAVISRAA